MRRIGVELFAVMLVSGAVAAGCGGSPPAAPSPPPTPGAEVPSPAVVSTLIGEWEGTTTFDSISGAVPSCIAPFWQERTAEPVSAYVYAHEADLAMSLRQKATQDCELLLAESPGRAVGGSWPNPDELTCYFFPSRCTPGCHVRARSSEWNCEGMPPEVWVTDAFLNTLVSGERDRMEGILAITYTYKPGGAVAGAWQDFKVVNLIDLRKFLK